MLDLQDKMGLVVFGEAGRSGLVGAMAARFRGLGASVWIVGPAETESLWGTQCDRFLPHRASDMAAAEAVVRELVSAQGRIDFLVQVLDLLPETDIFDEEDDTWSDRVLDGLTAPYAYCKAVARPMMKQRSGRIVLVASVAGKSGSEELSAAALLSGGSFGFIRSVARELAGRGVTANAVAVGLLEGESVEVESQGPRGQVREIPLGRLGRFEEVAGPVAFLASDSASYITGQVLAVDGGWVMG